MSYFELRHASLAFGGVRALRDLSFAVEQGEVFAIIGPNGAGKTTAVNVATRVVDADQGGIWLGGTEITRVPPHRMAAQGVARTFQNLELFEGATVLDNLLLGRHRFCAAGWLASAAFTPAVRRAEVAARDKAEEIIERLELEPWRDQPVGALPYGARKVVELGRALACEPKLLLLDEPASGLNPEETRDLSFWIEDLNQDLGITVVMVEHDMSLVGAVADRVLVMNEGARLALGTPDEVRRDPAVVAAYLGKPA
jgi:branched-chain amino acid transport system ATP-binding protein